MSGSRGHSSLLEARYTEQLIYLIYVGPPDAPREGLRSWGGTHAVIIIANESVNSERAQTPSDKIVQEPGGLFCNYFSKYVISAICCILYM